MSDYLNLFPDDETIKSRDLRYQEIIKKASSVVETEEDAIDFDDLIAIGEVEDCDDEEKSYSEAEEEDEKDENNQLVPYEPKEEYKDLSHNELMHLKNAYRKRCAEVGNLDLSLWKRYKSHETFSENNVKTKDFESSSRQFVRSTEESKFRRIKRAKWSTFQHEWISFVSKPTIFEFPTTAAYRWKWTGNINGEKQNDSVEKEQLSKESNKKDKKKGSHKKKNHFMDSDTSSEDSQLSLAKDVVEVKNEKKSTGTKQISKDIANKDSKLPAIAEGKSEKMEAPIDNKMPANENKSSVSFKSAESKKGSKNKTEPCLPSIAEEKSTSSKIEGPTENDEKHKKKKKRPHKNKYHFIDSDTSSEDIHFSLAKDVVEVKSENKYTGIKQISKDIANKDSKLPAIAEEKSEKMEAPIENKENKMSANENKSSVSFKSAESKKVSKNKTEPCLPSIAEEKSTSSKIKNPIENDKKHEKKKKRSHKKKYHFIDSDTSSEDLHYSLAKDVVEDKIRNKPTEIKQSSKNAASKKKESTIVEEKSTKMEAPIENKNPNKPVDVIKNSGSSNTRKAAVAEEKSTSSKAKISRKNRNDDKGSKSLDKSSKVSKPADTNQKKLTNTFEVIAPIITRENNPNYFDTDNDTSLDDIDYFREANRKYNEMLKSLKEAYEKKT